MYVPMGNSHHPCVRSVLTAPPHPHPDRELIVIISVTEYHSLLCTSFLRLLFVPLYSLLLADAEAFTSHIFLV